MKAITLHQPWASLIAHGVKTIETRSWAPPRRLIGQRIAIHAGKTMVVSGRLHTATLSAILELYGIGWGDRIPLGAVVATALLIDARQVAVERAGESPGRVAVLYRVGRTRSLRRLLRWPVVVVPHGCGAVQPPGSCGGASGIVGLET